MKRFVMIIATAVILYAIYYDISYGTLPAATDSDHVTRETASITKEKTVLPYFEKKISSGDTVLSIIEDHLDDSIPVPISNVVADFEKLNNGISPAEIQPGKTYKFPEYQ